MKGFEVVKYIKMYRINFAGILMRTVKVCISMHVGKTIQCFSVLFHQALHQRQVYLLQI